jgi:hypothetical protein
MAKKLFVGQTVDYKQCASLYRGVIVKITGEYLTIIDDDAGMELWNAGYAVGAYVHVSQLD